MNELNQLINQDEELLIQIKPRINSMDRYGILSYMILSISLLLYIISSIITSQADIYPHPYFWLLFFSFHPFLALFFLKKDDIKRKTEYCITTKNVIKYTNKGTIKGVSAQSSLSFNELDYIMLAPTSILIVSKDKNRVRQYTKKEHAYYTTYKKLKHYIIWLRTGVEEQVKGQVIKILNKHEHFEKHPNLDDLYLSVK
jgi:hypothetical protein